MKSSRDLKLVSLRADFKNRLSRKEGSTSCYRTLSLGKVREPFIIV